MNRQVRFLRQLGAACLGLAFSLAVLVLTPALAGQVQASEGFSFAAKPLPLAATAGRVKAGAKDIEGKTQESIGKVTGDKGDRIAGKAKQTEAKVRNGVENVKDKAGMG